MTKPHEETWVAHNDRVQLAPADETRTIATFVNEGLTPEDFEADGGVWRCIDRARLAAAAPDLVRALLDVEFSFGQCLSCYWENHQHSPDCLLDAALRKAGVRP